MSSENFGGAYWLFVTVTIVVSPFIVINWMYLLGFRYKWMHRVLFAPKFAHRFKNSIEVPRKHNSMSQLSPSNPVGSSVLPAPIECRGFWSLVIWNIGVMSAWTSSQWTIMFNAPCFVPFFLAVFGNFLAVSSFLERTIRLYFQFNICQQACQFAEEQFGLLEKESPKSSDSKFFRWLLRNRAGILKDSPFAIPKLIVFAYSFIATGAIMAAYFSRLQENKAVPMSNLNCQSASAEVYRVVIAMVLINSFFRLFLVRMMKFMEDSLGIKRELRMLGLNGLVGGLFASVFVFWPNTAESVRFSSFWYLMYFVSNAMGMGVAHFICIFNLFSSTRSFNKRFLSLKSSFSTDVTTSAHSQIQEDGPTATEENINVRSTIGIEIVLENPEASKMFEEFLRKEFSVENLLCYRAVQTLDSGLNQNRISQEEARKICKKIIQEFSGSNCRLPVNISSDTSDLLWTISNQEEASMPLEETLKALHRMQKEVLELMIHDSFRRFKTEEGFKSIQKKLTIQEI
jgi:hypothetical protein